MALVAILGAILGVLLAGRADADIGPFRAQFAVTPSLVGDVEIDIPPLGKLHLDSHDGPAHLSVRLAQLDQRRTEQLITTPDGVAQASATALTDLGAGLIRLGLRVVAVATLAGLLLGALVFRSVRRTAWCGGLALSVTAAGLLSGAATFRRQAIEEPRYEGLLVNAPAVVGDARRIAGRYDAYAGQLQKLVTNVGKLYATVSTLPVYEAAPGTIRALHVSDLHLNPAAWSLMQTVVAQFDIDLVIDTGDITDWGSEQEAEYVAAISRLKVPYVYIRGNHDSAATAAAVARQPGAVVLDGQVEQVAGLWVAGIGDPRFTPDKETEGQGKQAVERVIDNGVDLAAAIAASGQPVDVALVHDPAAADGLVGSAPLVLAGHTHRREVRSLAAPAGSPETRLMVSGSTGGAGLRGLEAAEPTPLAMSVLYFDDERNIQAYDDIRVGGTGQSQVTLERHVLAPMPTSAATSNGRPSPSPAGRRPPSPPGR
ncbi:metallophosphoesterase [Pilimelia columellifera subsp. columellifera]|uniref:Metallophosphoesterase n=1 Tax=Pilimelia columellifera subsp. columellifera TaxID=706583 RepID=A0ABN3NI89_9ACTN